MLGSKESFEAFDNMGITRSLDSQLEELKRIYKNAVNNTIDFTFDKIFIGNQDLIFPTKNQVNFWEGKSKIIELDIPHFPFFYFKSWDEIIN
jgi:biotin synthesis protein BioG